MLHNEAINLKKGSQFFDGADRLTVIRRCADGSLYCEGKDIKGFWWPHLMGDCELVKGGSKGGSNES